MAMESHIASYLTDSILLLDITWNDVSSIAFDFSVMDMDVVLART